MTWYEEDVKQAVEKRLNCSYTPKSIFYGSSTITLWDTLYEDFKDYQPINVGFGGSTLAACVWFFDEIVAPLPEPERFILYAGDNDLGDGRQPEEVCLFYREFMIKLREHYKHVPLYFVSIKPSISRDDIREKIVEANMLVKEEINQKKHNEHYVNIFDKMIDNHGQVIKKYFKQDGLHLNKKGYAVWKETILNECFLREKVA